MDDSDGSDDFEFEVTDLRTGQHKRLFLESPPDRQPAVSRNTSARAPAAIKQRHVPGMARMSPLARRRTISSVALALLLLITGAVVGSDPGTSSALLALIRLPFSTRATVNSSTSGEGSFVAVNGIPWGTVLLDGKRDPRANFHQDIFQGSFTLPPGRHTLEYRAAPFPTLRCIVSVPADPADTCPLVTSQQAGTLADPFPPETRMLDLRATPARLSPDQQAALVAAIQTALEVRTPIEAATVLPGERYVAADGSVTRATQPLHATYLYEFPWDAQSGLRDCKTLCVRWRSLPPYADEWIVVAHVRQGWRYTTPEGAPVIPYAPPVASNVAPLTPSGTSATDIYINLYIRWAGRWQVSSLSLAEFGDPFAIPTCAVGFDALLRLIGSGNALFTPVPPSHVATGCVLLVQRLTPDGSRTGQFLYYFYRFGVLLALNALAHAALPTLPVASTAEQFLARLIAVQAGQPSF